MQNDPIYAAYLCGFSFARNAGTETSRFSSYSEVSEVCAYAIGANDATDKKALRPAKEIKSEVQKLVTG